MANLINAKCPNCGAALELPEKLDRAFCMHCGGKVIIVKDEVHIHQGIGSIENYVKLAYRELDNGDFTKAQDYFQKALEIDADNKSALAGIEVALGYNELDWPNCRGDWKLARLHLKRALELEPKNNWAIKALKVQDPYEKPAGGILL